MSASLEARYRWLLRAYPPTHRGVHGEEMVGVLLSCAQPGRTRPGFRDATDLVRGGLLIRLRRIGEAGWADGVAVTGMVALLLMCALTPLGLAFGPFRQVELAGGSSPLQLFIGPLPWLVWPAILVLAWTGRRLAAGLLGAVALLLGHPLVYEHLPFEVFALEGAWRLLATAAVVGAVIPPGPRGAVRALGLIRTAAVVVGAGILSALHLVTYLSESPRLPRTDLPVLSTEQWLALGLGAGLLLLLCAVLHPGSGGRSTGVLLACPLAFYLVELLRQARPLSPDLREQLWQHGVLLGFLLAGAVMVASFPLARRRSSI